MTAVAAVTCSPELDPVVLRISTAQELGREAHDEAEEAQSEQIIRKLRDADRLGSRWKAVCEFEFSLWDADATGEQVGRTLTFDGWQPKQPRLVVGDGMIETAVASPIIRPQVYESPGPPRRRRRPGRRGAG